MKSWTIKKKITASQAAGQIHSDFERGFIKAEVFNFKDIQKYGSESLISIMNRNPESLFQVASKFNCLEFTQPPEKGITDYIFDETQGPQCALATAPSTFYRNYLIPISNEKVIFGQTGDTLSLIHI